ncbi:MAG: hypothetical protein IBX55_10920 [Methyloprofundus sp.]|nr:hypothetical protein [Methyloprofundus sp.]MBW6454046.1 hypothetical protein [Methyloprofundus sp.]
MKFPTVFNYLLFSSLVVVPVSATENPGYLQLKAVEYEVNSDANHKKLELEIKTQANIPVDGKSGAFGYAALTDGGNNVLVAVTHLPIDDSSFEKLPSGFHTHVLDLMAPSAACAQANFEVDLTNSAKNHGFDADYAWQVKKNKLTVKDIPVTDLGDAGVEAVVSFVLHPILDKNNNPTNLCVHVIDQQ